MPTKTLIALMTAAVLALSAVGCGDEEPSSPAGASPATEAPTATGDTTAATEKKSSAAKSQTLELAAASQCCSFESTTLTAKPGDVSIKLTNDSAIPHDVAVEKGGEDLGKSDEVSNGEATLELKGLKDGEYTFYCSVPGHRDGGMEGTLTVK